MKTIKGTVKNGQIALSEPIVWPDGTEVGVSPLREAAARGLDLDDLQPCDDEQVDDAHAIARWIAEFDAIPPLQMTDAEEAAWQAARFAQREFEQANLARRALGIGSAIE